MKNMEYHKNTNFSLWFYALTVQIGRIREKHIERNKIVKYSKLSYNCPKFEYVVCRDVFGGRKQFRVKRAIFLKNFVVSKERRQEGRSKIRDTQQQDMLP
jgi:hypothetical protein